MIVRGEASISVIDGYCVFVKVKLLRVCQTFLWEYFKKWGEYVTTYFVFVKCVRFGILILLDPNSLRNLY